MALQPSQGHLGSVQGSSVRGHAWDLELKQQQKASAWCLITSAGQADYKCQLTCGPAQHNYGGTAGTCACRRAEQPASASWGE